MSHLMSWRRVREKEPEVACKEGTKKKGKRESGDGFESSGRSEFIGVSRNT